MLFNSCYYSYLCYYLLVQVNIMPCREDKVGKQRVFPFWSWTIEASVHKYTLSNFFFLILFPFLPWPLNPVFLKASGFFSHLSDCQTPPSIANQPKAANQSFPRFLTSPTGHQCPYVHSRILKSLLWKALKMAHPHDCWGLGDASVEKWYV